MKLVCDEGVPRQIVEALRNAEHVVVYIAELDPGIRDEEVLTRAAELGAPLVTTDKDFGELVFRQNQVAAGVVLIRLEGLSNEAKATIVVGAMYDHGEQFIGAFSVISPGHVRIRRKSPPDRGQ